MEAQSEYILIACTSFARLAPICMLSRCLLNKFSASELRRKFIKSAFVVGWAALLVPHPGSGRLMTTMTIASGNQEDGTITISISLSLFTS